MKNIKYLIAVITVLTAIISCSVVFCEWEPDNWDVYEKEFNSINELTQSYVPKNKMDFKSLVSQFKLDSKNEDVQAWINIPDTNINLPVVYHDDIDYYAKKGYNKQKSFYGVIWADHENIINQGAKELSTNTVLYGHNWDNYTNNPKIGDFHDIMFGQVSSFHHLDFAKNHRYIYFSTEKENMVFKIFSAFYTEEEFEYHIPDPTKEQYRYILYQALVRSRFKYNVPVTLQDKIITLSTCTRAYGKRPDQKFVVMGRLLKKGETVNDILPELIENPNHKQPVLKPLPEKKDNNTNLVNH